MSGSHLLSAGERHGGIFGGVDLGQDASDYFRIVSVADSMGDEHRPSPSHARVHDSDAWDGAAQTRVERHPGCNNPNEADFTDLNNERQSRKFYLTLPQRMEGKKTLKVEEVKRDHKRLYFSPEGESCLFLFCTILLRSEVQGHNCFRSRPTTPPLARSTHVGMTLYDAGRLELVRACL